MKKNKRFKIKIERCNCPWKKWGNSVLAFNYKNWNCSYCGLPIKNATPFEIAFINGNPIPYVLCTRMCEKAQLIKIEMTHYDQ